MHFSIFINAEEVQFMYLDEFRSFSCVKMKEMHYAITMMGTTNLYCDDSVDFINQRVYLRPKGSFRPERTIGLC